MDRFGLARPNTAYFRFGLALAAILILATTVLVAMLSSVHGGESAAGDQPSAPVGDQPSAPTDGWVPSYRQDVDPILQRTCVQCHGSQQADKGLRLDSYQRMMAGDSYGTVVIPGDSSLSAIISVVKYGTMPHEGSRLTAREIETISRWIDAGAPEN